MNRCDALGLLDDIDNLGKGLTDWEIEFIDVMTKHCEAGHDATPAEQRKIRQIWEDRIP